MAPSQPRLTLTASLVPEADQAEQARLQPVWRNFWEDLRESIRLIPPTGSPLADEVVRLDAALPPEGIAGARYGESMMAFVDR